MDNQKREANTFTVKQLRKRTTEEWKVRAEFTNSGRKAFNCQEVALTLERAPVLDKDSFTQALGKINDKHTRHLLEAICKIVRLSRRSQTRNVKSSRLPEDLLDMPKNEPSKFQGTMSSVFDEKQAKETQHAIKEVKSTFERPMVKHLLLFNAKCSLFRSVICSMSD